MLDLTQCREWIIRKPMKDVGIWTQSGENLVMGIFGVETNWYSYCVQRGNPVAFGPAQCEQAAYYDIWNYCLRKKMTSKILIACGMQDVLVAPDRTNLIYNLRFAALICRMFFARFKDPLPEASDYESMADLHKRLYNTLAGSTDVKKSVLVFKKVCSYKED